MSAATAIRDESFSPPAVSAPSENWDDDFLFQADPSPAKPPPTSSTTRPRPARQTPPEQRWSSHSISSAGGGWDEELEREEAERQSSAGSSSLGPAAGAAVAPRTDLSRWAETEDDDEEEDYGLSTRHEDTVSPLPVFSNGAGNGAGGSSAASPGKRARPTSPSRSSTSTSASARSSPLMHTRQVPGSPALSLFSMSTSTAQQYTPSVASSTAHLRTTRSNETTTAGPFVPAQPRVPRRRLRKKSRPARPGDIAEHDDTGGGYMMREPSPLDGGGLGLAMTTEEEASMSESSHHHHQPVERTPSPPPEPVAGPSSPPVRSPLLSRIGSFKTKLSRRPKASVSASPPHAGTSTTSPIPVPSTPARTRISRSSTTPKQHQSFSPETPKTRPPNAGSGTGWFRSASATHVHHSSPEDQGQVPSLARRKSKEPFWKGVGSFSSGRSPVTDLSEADHEQTVKKPPRKSLNATTRPPIPSLPLPPAEAGSPTPPGTSSRLMKARRPMSMSGPASAPAAIPVGKVVPASLGRAVGAGWTAGLVEEEEREREKGGSVLRTLRKFSHSRKKSQTERIPSGQSTAPASSINTVGSRVPSSSTVPSLHDWDEDGRGPRRTSASFPKSVSAVVLSGRGEREFDPSGSVFTLPLGLGGNGDGDGERQSSSRPSSPLVSNRHLTGGVESRPSSPLATRRPSTPLYQRPHTPLAGPPVLGEEDEDEDEEDVSPLPALDQTVILKEPVTPSRTKHLIGSQPVVFEDGVEFAIFTPESEPPKPTEEEEDVVPEPAPGRPSLSSSSAGRTSGSLGRTSGTSGSIASLSPRSKIHRKSASLAHTKSASEPARLGSDLLPPIELQPPSPPQTLSGRTGEDQMSLLQLTTPPRSISGLITPSSTPSRLLNGNSPIGQSSSLSRAATQPGGTIEVGVLRRNSLSDLKIPARISRAQSGLKSNLGMVREFAGSIEQIRRLQTLYRNLLADLKYAIENGEPLSPVLFPRGSATSATLVRVPSRDIGRVADRLNGIDERYGLWWECADVLVELGGGNGNGRDDKPATATAAAPEKEPSPTTGRERAITLAGNQAAPTVEPLPKNKEQWDKERGELSPRQLQILREMLSTPNPSLLHVPLPPTNAGYLNALHPGGTASAVTLPSSSASSSHVQPGVGSQSVVKLPENVKSGPAPGTGKIRRASRAGINGIKDLLKHLNLKKPQTTAGENGSRPPTRMGSQSQVHLGSKSELNLPGQSQLNLGHQSQLNLPRQSQTHLPQTKRSHGPGAVQHKSSPRRPSLASIFRLNGAGGRSKSKGRAVSASQVGTATSSATEDDADESDWDRMDSASDLDLRIKAGGGSTGGGEEKDATLRGRKSGSLGSTRPPVPAIPAQFAASKSQISLGRRTPDEVAFGTGTDLTSVAGPSSIGPIRSGSNRFKHKTPTGLAQVSTAVGGVQPGLRSAPLQSPVGSGYTGAAAVGVSGGVEGRLALTPETIKPLLEYAREVTARLDECVAELRELGMNDGDKLGV